MVGEEERVQVVLLYEEMLSQLSTVIASCSSCELADRLVALRPKWPSASLKDNGVLYRVGWTLHAQRCSSTLVYFCSGGPVPRNGLWISYGSAVGILHVTLQIFNQFCLGLLPRPSA